MQNTNYLLEPVNALQPSGKDLTYFVEFDDIRQLRTYDDPTLDQGAWTIDLKVANWPEVAKRCSKLLQATTKDLRWVGWMTRAPSLIWTRLDLRSESEGAYKASPTPPPQK